ncbi:HNH endonuclease [Shewanella algae]|uniref:HNH endonuclease n=1 Tax=Shewanella algae TaxID=38313 RepID=UPI003CC7A1AD
MLQTHEHKCVECNRTKAEHNIVLHVDHILPRSKYPHKALDINNMQILCEDCNLGKLDK